jgi:hypothetical protein
MRAERLQCGGRFGRLVLGALEFLPEHRIDAKAWCVVNDDDAVLGRALVGWDAAGVGAAGRDDDETGSLKQGNIVGIVVRLINQLQQVSG